MNNSLESSYHIYEAHKQGIQMNEELIELYNPIFEVIMKNRPNNNPFTTYNHIPTQPPDNPLPPPI
jgi:hypothetical protein